MAQTTQEEQNREAQNPPGQASASGKIVVIALAEESRQAASSIQRYP